MNTEEELRAEVHRLTALLEGARREALQEARSAVGAMGAIGVLYGCKVAGIVDVQMVLDDLAASSPSTGVGKREAEPTRENRLAALEAARSETLKRVLEVLKNRERIAESHAQTCSVRDVITGCVRAVERLAAAGTGTPAQKIRNDGAAAEVHTNQAQPGDARATVRGPGDTSRLRSTDDQAPPPPPSDSAGTPAPPCPTCRHTAHGNGPCHFVGQQDGSRGFDVECQACPTNVSGTGTPDVREARAFPPLNPGADIIAAAFSVAVPEKREPKAERWRTGRKLGRTLYREDRCVGMVDNQEVADEIVAAMNENAPNDRAAIAEAIGREANRIFHTPDKVYPSNVLDAVAWNVRMGLSDFLSERCHPSGVGIDPVRSATPGEETTK